MAAGFPTVRYSTGAIWFHWTIAALVVANLAVGFLHGSVLPGTMPAHKAIGVTVLVLTLGRVAWRLMHRPPPLPAATPAIEKATAHAVHWALYLLLLVMPLSGWAMVSGGPERRPLTWFGLFDIPYLPVSPATGDAGHDVHVVLAWVMLALVALHVAAALRHHLILRDHVLPRIAPVFDRR